MNRVCDTRGASAKLTMKDRGMSNETTVPISDEIPVEIQDQYSNGLVQDSSISSALAIEILQSCTKA